jgi:GNAT superfamily N-acetyltransferase
MIASPRQDASGAEQPHILEVRNDDPLKYQEQLVEAYLAAYRDQREYAYRSRHDVIRYLRWLKRQCPEGIFIAFAEGRPVGFIAVDPHWLDPQGRTLGEMHEFVVHPDYQRIGAGRLLFSTAVDFLRRLGRRRLGLWVGEHNRKAQDFYARFGFRPVGKAGIWVRMEWEVPPEPAESPPLKSESL